MAIRNYTLTGEQAGKIPSFYFPGSEGFAIGMSFVDRNDERPNPTVEFQIDGIPNSRCKLTLDPRRPIVQHVDLWGPDNQIEQIKGVAERALKISLG